MSIPEAPYGRVNQSELIFVSTNSKVLSLILPIILHFITTYKFELLNLIIAISIIKLNVNFQSEYHSNYKIWLKTTMQFLLKIGKHNSSNT